MTYSPRLIAMKILVLAIGNKLLRDEGVGLHVLEALESTYPATADITYLDGGTLSFTLAEQVAEHEGLIVLDAAQLASTAGSLRCLVNEDMDQFLGTCKRSVHEVGLLDLLDIARLTGSLPQQRALIGIQPLMIEWGDNLSEPVAQTVPQAVQQAQELLHAWGGQDARIARAIA